MDTTRNQSFQGVFKNANHGQSVVELAVIFPIIVIFFAGIFDFGLYFILAHEVQSSAREGVRYAVALADLVENDSRITDRVNEMLPDNEFLSGMGTTTTVPDCDADGEVTVRVTGTYNFAFLNILGLNTLGVNVPASMRHESCGVGYVSGSGGNGGGGGGGGGSGGGIWGDDTICFKLNTEHTGSGGDPSFSPSRSVECATGYFVEDAVVTLTAAPGPYWEIDSWSQTNDDASRNNTNQLTMPANDITVGVNYVLVPCYTLSLSKNGNGSVPTATPTDSPHCDTDYAAGEVIDLVAVPDSGYAVNGWTGTDNDRTYSDHNTLTMPANDHSTSVTYIEQICYTLTISRSGKGNNPHASPPNCPGAKYIQNSEVILNAQPGAGWKVGSWKNTNNDSTTSTVNTVTMRSDLTVSVSYVEDSQLPPPLNVYIPNTTGQWHWNNYWRRCEGIDLRWSDNPAWTESPVRFEVFNDSTSYGFEWGYHWNANHTINLGQRITLAVRAIFPGGTASQIQEVTYACFRNNLVFWGSVIK